MKMSRPWLITGAALAAGLAAALSAGAARWRSATADLRVRLDAARSPLGAAVVDFRHLEGLPEPVDRYVRAVLTERQPMVAGARVRHRGTFNAAETGDRWRPFTSDQKVVTRRPGFDWDARIVMAPGLIVRVHDAYVAGEGILQAALFGLVPLVEVRGRGAVAEGELMRFFAESAWYPTALLPGEGIRWEAADDRSAYGTLTDGPLNVRLLFTFNAEGLLETVRADARARRVGDALIPTPWEGRFWNYHVRGGMRVPLDGEVAWLLPDGAWPYWRGRIVEIDYEFAPGAVR
jgi:hypothetical protein